MPIVLKNKDNADVTYTLVDRRANTAIYMAGGESLLSRSRLTLSLNERSQTNRVIGRLEIPTVLDAAPGIVPGIAYKEIGSFDLSSVLAASSDDALNFIAQFKSLVATDVVKTMYADGIVPAA